MRVLFLALAALLGSGTVHAEVALKVGKASPTAATMIPLEVGVKEGFFAKRGLAVEIYNFGGGSKLHQAMTAGSLDLGVGAGTDLALIAKGAPELAVANCAGPLLFIAMAVPKDSPAKSLADLKGARIGVTTVPSLTYWLALELARQRGWGPNGVTPIAVGGEASSSLAAFRTHIVDAGIVSTAVALQMEAKGEARLIAPVSSWAGELGGSVVFASRALIASNPDAIRRFILGWFDAVRFMRVNRAATVKIGAEMTGMPVAIQSKEYDLIMPMFNTNGRFDAEILATLKRSFAEQKLLDTPPDMSKLYTEEYLPKQ
jgi:NitT/TauT family transport system substrate-binding protein